MGIWSWLKRQPGKVLSVGSSEDVVAALVRQIAEGYSDEQASDLLVSLETRGYVHETEDGAIVGLRVAPGERGWQLLARLKSFVETIGKAVKHVAVHGGPMRAAKGT